MLAEQVRKDTNKTDITINIDKANVSKVSPLLKAFRKLQRCK